MAVEIFPNRPVERPHTNVRTDTSAITGSSSGSQKLVMLIGSAKGGRPNTVYRIRNYIQAKQLFREGDLLDALELAWNPAGGNPGAGDILAMRIEDASNASFVHDSVEFKSIMYGEEANRVQVELETITVTGSDVPVIGEGVIGEDFEVSGDLERDIRNLTISFAPDGYEHVYRDLGHIFTVLYHGDAETATMAIQGNQLILGFGAAGDMATTRFTLGPGRYEKANVLVNAINQIDGFFAAMPTGQDKNIDTKDLESLTETEVTTDGVQALAFKADLERQLRYDEYIEVEFNSSATSVADFELTNLEGGDDGIVPESWYSKIQQFANEGGYYLVPLTDRQAVHQEALSFVRERSNNGDPMRAIVGAGWDETAEYLLNRASSLRDARATLVGFSQTRTLDNGQTKQFPGFMSAAQVAGLASGLEIGESITFKNLTINGLSRIFEGSQLDTLNSGGVVMCEFVRHGTSTNFRLVDDVTTYNDTSDPVGNQMAMGEANDFLVSELKIHLDNNFIGRRATITSPALIKNSVQSFLDQKKRNNEIQDYNPEEVQVVINGEVADISLVVFPIRSIKKINVALVYRQQVLTST